VTGGPRAFIDLHCHTRASFDSLSSPADVVRAAHSRGLTHLAITDHDTIDGALEARDRAPEGLTVLIGEEVKTAAGDLICLYLQRAVPPGLSVAETIAAVREQGGLVGIPHPFDGYRSSLLRDEGLTSLASLVDWVEAFNARVVFSDGNEKAALFAAQHGLAGVAVSDAHTILEVAVASTVLNGDPSTPAGLLAALSTAQLATGRASYFVRGVTPVAKLVQRLRGVRRVAPGGPAIGPGTDEGPGTSEGSGTGEGPGPAIGPGEGEHR
jgi:predicted metal-dependent phosphoesterase TrpH